MCAALARVPLSGNAYDAALGLCAIAEGGVMSGAPTIAAAHAVLEPNVDTAITLAVTGVASLPATDLLLLGYRGA